MWCRCTGGGKLRGYRQQEGDSDLWVCGRCLKPSRMVFDKVTDMLIPKGATAMLHLKGRSDGIFETTFAMADKSRVTTLSFHPYPRKVNMEQGRALLLETWKLLDAATEVVLTAGIDSGKKVRAKSEARAYANVLALFMQPFFNTADEVVREAVARHNARQYGVDHVTPGLAEEIWDPMKNWDGSPRVEFSSQPTKPKSVSKLQPQQEIFIRKAVGDGTMKAEVLADMFKVDVSVINEIVG